MLAIIIVLGGGTIALQAYFTYVNRDLGNALMAKNAHAFYRVILIAFVWIMVMVPVSAYQGWLTGRLTIVWREWLTNRFIAMGFQNRAFYRMIEDNSVDNPDQRISEDLNSFAGGAINYFLTTLQAIVTTIAFFGILWSLSHFLSIALLFYAAAGSYLSVVVGRRLVGINFQQQRYEADFRYGLVHMRNNVEPIFMYGGEAQETGQLSSRFAKLAKNFNLLILWQRHLELLTGSYSNLIAVLPFFLLAGAYFAGKLQFGQLLQASNAFGTLSGSLSLIVNNFEAFAGYAAVVNRLATFADACEATPAPGSEGKAGIETVEDDLIEFQHLTLTTPDQSKTLITDMSLTVSKLEPLLIGGASGIGKTSLLRAIAGIWQRGQGRVIRQPLTDVMFLPQKPYMILGSLRDQLRYPRAPHATDEELREMLAVVNLADLPDRLGGLSAELNWPDVLSMGELQRLAFARLLLNRPHYAFLDEATSALDPENEALLYECLIATDINFLSVGHRPSLLKFHRNALLFTNSHEWTLSPSPEFVASQPAV